MLRILLAAALAGAVLSAAPAARADGLSGDELGRLARGETVSRPQTIENDAHRYVGGVTYTVIDATLAELERIFDDVPAYRRLMPRTKSAVKVGAKDGDPLVELRQGNAVVEVAYTVRLHKERASRSGVTVRFWMDKTRPHGIEDAWGFFRAEPMAEPGKVLLSYGVLVEMGDGLASLFEERVRAAMLYVPQLVRGYVAERHAADERKRVTLRD